MAGEPMDDQVKTSGGTQQGADTPGTRERDLSFLWPVIDRIRAVEIKFQADSAAPGGDAPGGKAPAADVNARLKALEGEIAAIKQTLQDALGVLTKGVSEAAAAVTAAVCVELPPHSWQRVAVAAVLSIALLLLAHWLVVFVYDLPTLGLRLVSIAIPLPIAWWLTLRHRIKPWFEIVIAVTIGSVAVFGMSYVTSVLEKTAFLPENMREWQETIEYIASITFAYLTGVLISSARQARSSVRNRPGEAILQLARVLAFVTGKAIAHGPQLKKQVDTIQGLVNNLMPIASAIIAVVTGIKGILN
jgi:hypothetical protein